MAAAGAASPTPNFSSSEEAITMSRWNHLVRWLQVRGSGRGPGDDHPRGRSSRPRLEWLEDRTVLSPLVPGPTSLHATEGLLYDGQVGTFTDGNSADTAANFTATIVWGDNTSSAGTVTGSAGRFSVSGQHTYAEEGNFPLSAVVTDNQGHSITLGGPPQWTQTGRRTARRDQHRRRSRNRGQYLAATAGTDGKIYAPEV